MTKMHGASAYARVGVESEALSASPHKLITMLFDGAQASIRSARLHMLAGNIEEKGKATSKAMNIVNAGLAASLDVEKGGEVAENLMKLYEYVSRLLLQANRENDDAKFEQASELLDILGEGWREAGGQGGKPA